MVRNAMKLIFLILFVIHIATCGQLRFQIFHDYKILSIANTTVQMLSQVDAYKNEGMCMNACSNELGTAIAFNRISKVCYVNQYGRFIISRAVGFTTFVKCILKIFNII